MENVKIPGKRLGKLPARPTPHIMKLSASSQALPTPPLNGGYESQVPQWNMFLNDQLGDCTISAAANMVAQWTAYTGNSVVATRQQIVTAYSAVSGYVEGDPLTDNGAYLPDVLAYWKASGISGHRIVGYVSVNPKNDKEIQQAVYLFGNCYVGLGLPISAQYPFKGVNGMPVWDVPPEGITGDGEGYSWGGHCVPIVAWGVDIEGNKGVQVISWGEIYDMTWAFVNAYQDEAFAIVSTDWFEKSGLAVSGFDYATLLNDLTKFS